jgi:hypothetical protein
MRKSVPFGRSSYLWGGRALDYGVRRRICNVERTLVDSVKMQSVPEDEQCEHFELDGVPLPAEYQEEMRQ